MASLRILLLHPEDSAEQGPWARERWDRVLDLGIGGAATYSNWSAHFRCPCERFPTFKMEDFRAVRSVLESGYGHLLDREGLDWWELTWIFFLPQIELLMALRRFVAGLGSQDQVFVSRPGLWADGLRVLLGQRSRAFPATFVTKRGGIVHYSRLLYRFRPARIAEIFWDKYDADYNFRRRFATKAPPCGDAVILLPTAYVNVSATGIAYAKTFPDRKFLLVATRASGREIKAPDNVTVRVLSSYALPASSALEEYSSLIQEWECLRPKLTSVPEIDLLGRVGILDQVPGRIRVGLGIRNGWLEVLKREPVSAVLSADVGNSYTRIPLLLAKKRALPTIACHHGALDGLHLIRQNHADVILAKGRMEQDYLTRVCGVPASEVAIGAPDRPGASKTLGFAENSQANAIVFFSEPYEVDSGRAEEFYRDLLPPLMEVARRTGKELIIKLHPFESRRERTRLVQRVLGDQAKLAQVVSGRLTRELLLRTCFAITVQSTTATECALMGIPCFLAQWLEFLPYGYVEQFARFHAGRILSSPDEIAAIPGILMDNPKPADAACELWQPISKQAFTDFCLGRDTIVASGDHRVGSNPP